jgi:beta-N-acetylhexosaminidase
MPKDVEQLRIAVGQKLMLDIRYFCSDTTARSTTDNQLVGYHPHQSSVTNKLNAVIELPLSVATLLTQCHISGVILFAENIVDAKQVRQLTADIQGCSINSSRPMLISIDQEGGRVARLPRDVWPAFTGNMSLGAIGDGGDNESETASFNVGKAIGQQLNALGINVNHAPTVDVNVNHQNPVINVRSFGDNPQCVAQLGLKMGEGMLDAGIIPTFKHFPGHGDTFVDSHTGLPCVNHDNDTVHKVDLLPFKHAIENGAAPMIMTAHIQYPALDTTTFLAKTGEEIVRPATLSSKILTDLLRHGLGYDGVVITDALDMASISNYLSPLDVILETFKAGADIALMPFKIHTQGAIDAFYLLFEELINAIASDDSLCTKIMESYQRISLLKQSINPKLAYSTPPSLAEHRRLEREVALKSLVQLKTSRHINIDDYSDFHIVFPSIEQANAMANELNRLRSDELEKIDFRCYGLIDAAINQITPDKKSLIIVGVEDKKSVVDVGGVDDLSSQAFNNNKPRSDIAYGLLLKQKEKQGASIFISLKAPYHLSNYVNVATNSLASFDGSTYQEESEKGLFTTGPAFWALAQVIANKEVANGKLPISL